MEEHTPNQKEGRHNKEHTQNQIEGRHMQEHTPNQKDGRHNKEPMWNQKEGRHMEEYIVLRFTVAEKLMRQCVGNQQNRSCVTQVAVNGQNLDSSPRCVGQFVCM